MAAMKPKFDWDDRFVELYKDYGQKKVRSHVKELLSLELEGFSAAASMKWAQQYDVWTDMPQGLFDVDVVWAASVSSEGRIIITVMVRGSGGSLPPP
jgi:hypothetical protein